jgi:hypothetical protein
MNIFDLAVGHWMALLLLGAVIFLFIADDDRE